MTTGPHAFNRLLPLALAPALVAAATLAGCYYEGGNFASLNQFTYVSTAWEPKTITLKDTRTGQDLWSVDIPVGKQLVIDFYRDTDPHAFYPDTMRWGIMDDDVLTSRLDHEIRVPDRTSRRVDMELRPAPELPMDETYAQQLESGKEPTAAPTEPKAPRVDPMRDVPPATPPAPAPSDKPAEKPAEPKPAAPAVEPMKPTTPSEPAPASPEGEPAVDLPE